MHSWKNNRITSMNMNILNVISGKSDSAYYLSNGGLGDNIISIGAIRFLLQYYKIVYFLCKTKYSKHIKSLLSTEPRISLVTYNEQYEIPECINIIKKAYSNNDIFISGSYKRYLQSKITNQYVLNYIQNKNKYDLNHDTITDANFSFIREFYEDIGLDLRVFYEYFHIESTDMSRKLYDSVKHYNRIIFTQPTASTGETLDLTKLKEKYIDDYDAIILCNNYNVYDKYSIKYDLSQSYVMNDMSYYIDTIVNCDEIYIIDSCFIAIILPLLKTGRLKATIVRIILRKLANKIKLI
jgi:hypothetical protein